MKLTGTFLACGTSLSSAPVMLECSLVAELVTGLGGFELPTGVGIGENLPGVLRPIDDDRAGVDDRGVSSSLGVPSHTHTFLRTMSEPWNSEG